MCPTYLARAFRNKYRVYEYTIAISIVSYSTRERERKRDEELEREPRMRKSRGSLTYMRQFPQKLFLIPIFSPAFLNIQILLTLCERNARNDTASRDERYICRYAE